MTTNAELTEQCLTDIRRYDTGAQESVVQSMVKSYGLVMRKRDASTVACSDPAELATVRDNFLKKKLGLGGSDAELDGQIAAVCASMQGDRNKNRLTFYYLLAKNAGKLGVFG